MMEDAWKGMADERHQRERGVFKRLLTARGEIAGAFL
jgi:hypothetical protein